MTFIQGSLLGTTGRHLIRRAARTRGREGCARHVSRHLWCTAASVRRFEGEAQLWRPLHLDRTVLSLTPSNSQEEMSRSNWRELDSDRRLGERTISSNAAIESQVDNVGVNHILLKWKKDWPMPFSVGGGAIARPSHSAAFSVGDGFRVGYRCATWHIPVRRLSVPPPSPPSSSPSSTLGRDGILSVPSSTPSPSSSPPSSSSSTLGRDGILSVPSSTPSPSSSAAGAEEIAEACDVAVDDLSMTKAKVKLAQEKAAMETMTGSKEKQAQLQGGQQQVAILTRVRNTLIGIGPALRAILAMSRGDWEIKIQGWKKAIIAEARHYWLGTKLLWADVRIASRLLMKLAMGKTLSRREKQQLTRTSADVFRLVPFAVFIIVPFMEFLLPFFLKIFPNMLPSTFQDKMKEEETMKKRLQVRLQYAKFMQDIVAEMAREVNENRTGEMKNTAETLGEFINKVRTGGRVSNTEIVSFAKLFNDELTLDNISRPRLVSMCKYMGLSPYGTDAYLRYILRAKLAWIKEDDQLIQIEGVDSLSEAELRSACRQRGILNMSMEEMRRELVEWLDLSLNRSLPSSLLILSRAFNVGEVKPEEAMQATLSSLPDEVVEVVSKTASPTEEALKEKERKLEILKQQDELIKEEEKREEQREKESKELEGDRALEEMLASTAKDAQEEDLSKATEQKEQLCKLSSALAVLASASSVSKERADFLNLVNKEINLYNSMVEKEGTEQEEEAKQAYQAAHEASDRLAGDEEEPAALLHAAGNKASTALIEKVDKMLHNLEKELDAVDQKIGDRFKILDRDHDGKVTPDEVAAAAAFLKNSLDHEPLQELIARLSKDKDGKILVEDIVRLGAIHDPAQDERLIK